MKKILALSLTDEQRALLDELMAAAHATNKSAFVVGLLSAEHERRNKRPVGRPTKKDSDSGDDEEPRDIPNPNPMDVKDRPFLTESEWKWLYKDKPIPNRST